MLIIKINEGIKKIMLITDRVISRFMDLHANIVLGM